MTQSNEPATLDEFSGTIKENFEIGKLILTQSSIKTFRNCPKKFYLRQIRQIVQKREDTGARFLGTVFHDALAAWYTLDLEGKPKNDAAINDILKTIDLAFSNAASGENLNAKCNLIKSMFTGYIARYPSENFTPVAVERKFLQPIFNPATGAKSRTFDFSGKMDLIVQMKETGLYYVYEHKTATTIDGCYIDRLSLDTQVLLYTAYAEMELGIPIEGVIYNVVKKSLIKQKSGGKKGTPETDAEFMARLHEKYTGDEADAMFYREEVLISRDEIKLALAELWQSTQHILSQRRDNVWVKNTDNCMGIYNNSPCDYFALCRSGDNENILQNYYRSLKANSELADSDKLNDNDAIDDLI